MNSVLLVEDDLDLGHILKKYLEMNDFKVIHKIDGMEAWNYIQDSDVSICILDVMLPKMDGFELSRRIKKLKPHIPYLFLTAKRLKKDVITGLKIGADDYITKPFEAEELVLRIKNILSRTKSQLDEECAIGEYIFYPNKQELKIQNEMIQLTVLESDLLKYLLQNKNRIIKRESILYEVWSEANYFTGRSMDVFISRIRKYLSKDENVKLVSFRGKGVMLKITTSNI